MKGDISSSIHASDSLPLYRIRNAPSSFTFQISFRAFSIGRHRLIRARSQYLGKLLLVDSLLLQQYAYQLIELVAGTCQQLLDEVMAFVKQVLDIAVDKRTRLLAELLPPGDFVAQKRLFIV